MNYRSRYRMMRASERIWKVIFCFLLVSGLTPAPAQTPQAAFDISPSVCREQFIVIDNQSTGADRYQWDFCIEDFKHLSSNTLLPSVSGFSGGAGYKLIQDQHGNWFGFAVGQFSYTLHRLSFGNSPLNTPVITSLGNPGNALNQPQGIDIAYQNGTWFGFVGFTQADAGIVRLDFGAELTNTPVASNLGVFGIAGARFWDVRIIKQSNDWILVTINRDANSVVRINFRNSFSNAVNPASDVYDTGAIPGANLPLGLDVIYTGTKWVVMLPSYFGNSLQQLSFANNILGGFTSEALYSFASLSRPYNLRLVREGNLFIAFVNNESAGVSVIDLKDLNPAHAPEEVPLSALPPFRGSSVVRWQGKTILHGAESSTSTLSSLAFYNACGATFDLSEQAEPDGLFYIQAGLKRIELISTNTVSGEMSYTMQETMVSSFVAPDISFTTQNSCANHDVFFTSQNTSGNLTNYTWTFGDAAGATTADAVHAYASSGSYEINLVVTSSNACQNFARTTIQVYDEPVADFTTPSASPLCTHQNFLFTNTTSDVGYVPLWEWSINGTPVSSGKDLTYTFTSAASQEVTLKASIPGCESEKAVTLNALVAGPLPDFAVAGQCEDSNVTFTNMSTGAVSGYNWDFGDSQSSTATNPVTLYANPGPYTVTLTASNAAGCNNSVSKAVAIYSVPQVNFTALAPPFSCTGTATQFNDLTPPPPDSNLSSWLWNFGDAGSSSNTSDQKNPQHTYASAADYSVALTVTSNFSCSNTLQKTVTIHQTPAAAFNHAALCEDSGVAFTDAASTNQAWSWQIGSNFYDTESIVHTFNNPGSYDVILSVTGINNCVGSTSQALEIPPKLHVDFTTLRSCINQETEFTDITDDASDPITHLNWNFGGLGTAVTSPATFTFLESGTVNVTLTAGTQSGCEYPVTKAIAVAPGPLAAFTAIPNTGEAPLVVQFDNTSLRANTYVWKFNSTPGSGSTETSPVFIYADQGNYTVELVATDLSNCVDTTHQLIEVLGPAELNPPSPNPGKGEFIIEWQTPEATKTAIVVVDALGREIRHFEVMAATGMNRYILDIRGEQPGAYILNIRYLSTLKTYRLMLSE